MRLLLPLLLTIWSLESMAQDFTVRVQDIDISPTLGEETLVFLSNGIVAKIPVGDERTNDFIDAKLKKRWLKITLDARRWIVDHTNDTDWIDELPLKRLAPEYKLSVLPSIENAKRLFKEARLKNKDSQCFNRAHVWSYEWKIKRQVNSSKMFAFFTRKYIREHNFKWWFHVAPYVHVVVGNKIKERIMDVKFMSGPSTVNEWLFRFMKESPQCATVKTYSDYAHYPETGRCYLMRSSMYYYWPLDLEMEDLNGTKKNFWVEEEVKQAYLEAFDINLK